MIEIVSTKKEWLNTYRQGVKRLERIFKALPVRFFHIGSTAIPNCDAKPIIDILCATSDLSRIDHYNSELKQLGYSCLGEYGTPYKRFFCKRGESSIHLHCFEDSDPEIGRYLSFCRNSYTRGKCNFIRRIDRQAAFLEKGGLPPS